ncbi:MAG: tRNA (N6-threonylcarbamoyladenosine(37)-N6)-methyltransferase TrmO [Methanobacterium sp.]|nr:tRNA (N6-threonylcarbamoyladenosine(37)-N6)-methyltransferase TrmO [Methanobacterium sp.]
METIEYMPIGVIRSPFKNLEGMPIQPVGARGVRGEVHLKDEYIAGLADIDQFSHIILIYHFHKSKGFKLKVKPFLDNNIRGLFATRAPKRPNPIGLSVVRNNRVTGNIIHISNVDVLDGTPLLDIKPYIPQMERDEDEEICIGWLKEVHHKAKEKKSDKRFIN